MKQVNITIQNVSFYSNLVFGSGQLFHKAIESLKDRCLQNLPPTIVTSFYLYDQKSMI